jgi:hypothetical protein
VSQPCLSLSYSLPQPTIASDIRMLNEFLSTDSCTPVWRSFTSFATSALGPWMGQWRISAVHGNSAKLQTRLLRLAFWNFKFGVQNRSCHDLVRALGEDSSIVWKVQLHNSYLVKYLSPQGDFRQVWFGTWQSGQDSFSESHNGQTPKLRWINVFAISSYS